MAEAPIDNREFLVHCAQCLMHKSFVARDLVRMFSMAEMHTVAEIWTIMDKFNPDFPIPIDEPNKTMIVMNAIVEATKRLDARDAEHVLAQVEVQKS